MTVQVFPRQPLHDDAHLEPCLQAVLKDARLAEGPWADLGTGSGALAIGLASMPHPPPEVQESFASLQSCKW